MVDSGEFQYQCNLYMFIERYHIAFQDEWGYAELIVHPPPYNMLLITILPSVINKHMMQASQMVFSRVNFLIENLILYIPYQLYLEVIQIPTIYIKRFVSIISLVEWYKMPFYLIGWAIGGLLFLTYAALLDMYHFIKILCDSKEEREVELLKKAEDEKQDRMVIYNEIISVMKIIMFIFYQKQMKKLNIKLSQTSKLRDIKADSELEPLLKIQEDSGDDRPCEGYMLSKEIIIEAWELYRPVKKKGEKSKPKVQYVSDLKRIYPERFMDKMMAHMKLKQYDFKSTDKQIRRKKLFKENFVNYYKEKLEHDKQELSDGETQRKHLTEQERLDQQKLDSEMEIVDKFLSQFVLECNQDKNNIFDVKLALKAVPSKITSMNEFQCQLFNYEFTKSSIIDFQNSETDKLFKYFDDRNMQRLTKLNGKASITKDQTH